MRIDTAFDTARAKVAAFQNTALLVGIISLFAGAACAPVALVGTAMNIIAFARSSQVDGLPTGRPAAGLALSLAGLIIGVGFWVAYQR